MSKNPLVPTRNETEEQGSLASGHDASEAPEQIPGLKPAALTSNPIQTLHAAAQPHAFLGQIETEDCNITTNPIQT